MSPILVRPVREQLEHDRVIRLLQAKYKKKFDVAINPGSVQAAPVLIGSAPWYPDLVLTSALIPPRDEALLRGWLRDLGDQAAYVQTVTIPTLATTSKSAHASASLATRAFSLVGGQRPPTAEPDGCDRAVFADYVALYVDLASAERGAGRRGDLAGAR